MSTGRDTESELISQLNALNKELAWTEGEMARYAGAAERMRLRAADLRAERKRLRDDLHDLMDMEP